MNTRKLILTALFASIGIVLPQVIHLFGGPTLGQTLLPMHIPVFIGAMLLGPLAGIIIAVISVGAGVMLGMPTPLIASYMIVELVVYAIVSGLLYYRFKWNIFISYGIAKISGMASAILIIQLYIHLLGLDFPPIFGTVAMFSAGMIGIILQIVIIPPVVTILKKEVNRYGRIS